MKFFFPDSQDQVDPSFDFITEQRSVMRVRQRDDLYAHEALRAIPYRGMLVSKAIVDGIGSGAGKYTFAQRHRLYREGVRRFYRLDAFKGRRLESLGDCGAFSYVAEEEPPYSVDEVIDFYEGCGFDLGISVDHVILGYLDSTADGASEVPESWRARQRLTLDLAADFLSRHVARRCRFTPLGVAQGWDPPSFAAAVEELQRLGYHRIALGGMVPLKTNEILRCLAAVDDVRHPDRELHLLGVTRCEHAQDFARFGVTSFDSTSPFRQAFKDEKDNYYTLKRTYSALRVPQVDGNSKLRNAILAGRLDQREAVQLETACLDALNAYDRDKVGLGEPLQALSAYERFLDVRSHATEYEEILADRPWKACKCGICATAGIHVAIFRGTERNKRRGFHNLFVFNKRLQRVLAATARRQKQVA